MCAPCTYLPGTIPSLPEQQVLQISFTSPASRAASTGAQIDSWKSQASFSTDLARVGAWRQSTTQKASDVYCARGQEKASEKERVVPVGEVRNQWQSNQSNDDCAVGTCRSTRVTDGAEFIYYSSSPPFFIFFACPLGTLCLPAPASGWDSCNPNANVNNNGRQEIKRLTKKENLIPPFAIGYCSRSRFLFAG